jgi:hypothetical protein
MGPLQPRHRAEILNEISSFLDITSKLVDGHHPWNQTYVQSLRRILLGEIQSWTFC